MLLVASDVAKSHCPLAQKLTRKIFFGALVKKTTLKKGDTIFSFMDQIQKSIFKVSILTQGTCPLGA